jgi:hypothetical protein
MQQLCMCPTEVAVIFVTFIKTRHAPTKMCTPLMDNVMKTRSAVIEFLHADRRMERQRHRHGEPISTRSFV